MILKAYKYQLNPKLSQIEIINKHLGCARFIYNWGLGQKIELYKNNKQKLSCNDLSNQMTQLKKQESTIWLQEVYSQILQQSLRHLDSAFSKFFKEKKGFPRFKSKKNKCSFSIPQNVKVNFHNNTIYLPKIGEVKFRNSRQFTGKIKTCTVSRTPTNKYYVSILVETNETIQDKQIIIEDKTIGIDLGLIDFATLSTGETIHNPKHLNKSLKRLKCLQRRHLRKKKQSKNREKSRIKLAKQYEKIRNQRNDFLHQVSTKIIRENQTIVLEDLNVSGMMKNHKLAKSISDVGWSTFVNYLKYKSEWYGNNLLFIDRFEPSSKKCNNCGSIKENLTLKDRNWICEICHIEHDRDINAAINIKKIGLEKVNLIKHTHGQWDRAWGDIRMLEKSLNQEPNSINQEFPIK